MHRSQFPGRGRLREPRLLPQPYGGALVIQPLLTQSRVLIVEDDMLVAMSFEDFVADHGCTHCYVATSIPFALAALDKFAPTVVLLDVALQKAVPDFIVADALAERGFAFVFVSALLPNVIPARHSARPFVRKPFADHDMANGFRQAMGGQLSAAL